MAGSTLSLAVIMIAAGFGSVMIPCLLAYPSRGRTYSDAELIVGTTVFCTSIGLIWVHHGFFTCVTALVVLGCGHALLSSRQRPSVDRVAVWASAFALFLYIALI